MTDRPQAVILAAGAGSRLGRLTAHRTKAMLPICGRPLVGRMLDRLNEAGFRRVVVVGALHDAELAAYLERRRAGLPPEAALELAWQPQKRGTADALACAAPFLEGPFLLTACDNLVKGDYLARLGAELARTGAHGVLGLLPMTPEQLQHSAAVDLGPGGRVRRIVEKPPPGSIDSPLGSIFVYAFSPRLLRHLDVPLSKRGEREIQDAIQALIDAGGVVRGLVAPGRLSLTRPADLLAINLIYLERGPRTVISAPLPPDVNVVPPVRVEAGVQVGAGCSLGPRLYLEGGCRIGPGARLGDAVVLRDGVVAPGQRVTNQVLAGSG